MAIIGCDYNSNADNKGVKQAGAKFSSVLVKAMLKVWNDEQAYNAQCDRDFLMFAAETFKAQTGLDNDIFAAATSRKIAETQLKNIRAHKPSYPGAGPNTTFADELNRVASTFASQRQLAAATAANWTRAQAQWTGSGLKHGELIKCLEDSGLSRKTKSKCDEVLVKVTALEAERTARLGEVHAAEALLSVSGIAKVKEWYKAKEVAAQVRCATAHALVARGSKDWAAGMHLF
jgi:hypothetical protein